MLALVDNAADAHFENELELILGPFLVGVENLLLFLQDLVHMRSSLYTYSEV